MTWRRAVMITCGVLVFLNGQSDAHSTGAAVRSPAASIAGFWQAEPPWDWIDPKKDPIPLTPEYAAKLARWRQAADSGMPIADSVARCEAFGMPRMMSFGLFEMLVTPGRVTMITEILHEVRRIYTDGRRVPDDLDPTYGGYSVGHWEGKALVVSTVALQANTLDQYGIPHSARLRIEERIELVDPNRLRDRVTLNDPEAYIKPWTVERFYKRWPATTEIQEYICNTNGAALPASENHQ